jgi:hypothetical protein
MTNLRFQRIALVIAVVGALHGLAYLPLVQKHEVTDSWAYRAAAHALLQGSYTTPLHASFYYTYPVGFFDLTGVHVPRHSPVFDAAERQTFRPPGYPLLLASVGNVKTAALVLQALLLGVAIWLLALTVRLWAGPRVALASAGLYALDPYSKHYVVLLLSETLSGVLVVAAAYAFTRAWQERAVGWWSAAGALIAALTLTRAVFVVAVPLVVVAALLRPSRRARNTAAAAAATAVLLTPWLVWTNHVTGRPVLADWGEGFNLLLAAHGEGIGHEAAEIEREPAFLRDFAAARRTFPSRDQLLRDPTAHPRYLREADAELAARARELYRRRLGDEPLQVLWENAYRNYFLWSTHHDWYQPHGVALVALQAVDWVLIILALVGIAAALTSGGAAAAVAVFLLAYSATLSTHHVEARFSIPLRGLFLAYVVLGLAAVARKTANQKGNVPVAPTE